ncbi:histidine--tRNA ligase [Patescibacteria group bacterium]|nr:MAG: histidine--tRNA ligase [Patescibacteria group bacterium]
MAKKEAKKISAKATKAELPAETAPKKTRIPATPQPPRGMKDILPVEEKFWSFVRGKAESIARAYGYDWLETPILEETPLFVRAIGKQTDIVEKEMFTFVDQSGESLTLRPEATAPIARAYVNHGMLNLPQPVKFFYIGPMFRHERPQSGRYRQFNQFGCEILGDAKPVIDAELIILGVRYFDDLGIPVGVEINSIGDAAERAVYREKLIAYYRSHRSALCENCKLRLVKNPLRLLDCKEEGCRKVRGGAPQLVDFLNDENRNHFMKVLEFLDDADIPYVMNPYLVRGLDYYNKTVFEFVPRETQPAGEVGAEAEARQSSLGGGGRYDPLVEILGGRATPGAGFAIGLERVILRLKEINAPVPETPRPAVYLAQLGEPAKRKALAIFEELRRAGIPVAATFTKDALKAQMEIANKLGVKYAIILGQKEVLDGTMIIRDMDAGIQELVDAKKIVAEIRKKLATPGSEEPKLPS